jgi:quercetin dioxygenase-like cupin family protein
VRVTRSADAPAYEAALHHGVSAVRLQGHEAGPTDRFWVGLSSYAPGGGAEEAAAREETVYVALDGELVVTAEGREEVIGPRDSVHLAKGTVRRVDNRTENTVALLVIIALPPLEPS